MVRRLSVFGRSGLLSGGSPMSREVLQQPSSLHLSVRIGVATGSVPYGTSLDQSTVKHRAKSECAAVLCCGCGGRHEAALLGLARSC
jgi:hypothetical protein